MVTQVTNKDFVVAWVEAYNKGNGVEGVASKLSLEKASVSAKANYLRKQGVELPAMPRGRTGYSVSDLNQIITSRVGK